MLYENMAGMLSMIFILAGGSGNSANISINTTNVLRVMDRAVGINLDFLVDNEATYSRSNSLSDALAELGVGSLRFPMGELADRYLFAYDTVNSQDVSRCSIQGALNPFENTSYVDQATSRFPGAMTTDGFVDLVQEQGAVPFFVVGIDAILKDRSCGRTDYAEVEGCWRDYVAASRAEVYAAASNWVAYVKDRGVTGAYWEIGNENYLDSQEVGGWVAEKYAEVVNDLSGIIRSVDPTAKVGCNGGTAFQSDWWDRVLPVVEDSVDFMIVHAYMTSGLADYNDYINYTGLLTHVYETAKWKRDTLVSTANRDRIKICVTEVSSFIPGGSGSPNNLGKALMNFNIIGDFLQKPEVSYLHFWITRYLGSTVFASGTWAGLYRDSAAVDDDNTLLPMGQALQLWTMFSHDQILQAQDDRSNVVVYASSRSCDNALTLYILNRSLSGKNATVTLNGFTGNTSNACWLFSGSDPDDTVPTLKRWSLVSVVSNVFNVWLMPYSITIVEFAPDFSLGVPYNLISYNSGALLELDDPVVDGSNAVIWEDRGKWAKQEWCFEKGWGGYYEVVNQAVAGTYKRLEVANPQSLDCNVVGWEDRGDWDRQKWSIGYDSAGCFTLVNKAVGKALEVMNGGVTNGTNVQVGDMNGWNKQRWLIVPAP